MLLLRLFCAQRLHRALVHFVEAALTEVVGQLAPRASVGFEASQRYASPSICASISAPTSITMVESHIHTMKPTTAPGDP